MVSLHDIATLSWSPDERIDHGRQFLMLWNHDKVTQTFGKAAFFTNRVVNLDHVIKPGFLAVSSHTIYTICGLQTPSIIMELLDLQGLCNVFCWILMNVALIVAFHNRNLQKDQACVYMELLNEELRALKTLQGKLTSTTVLALPRSQSTYTAILDACARQRGYVLLQYQPDEHNKLIEYWSRSLTDAKRAYDQKH